MHTKKALALPRAILATFATFATLAPLATMTVAMAATPNSDNVPESAPAGQVGPKMHGTTSVKRALVLRAQVLLGRAHFSSGEIDAAYGKNVRNAITGYQKAHDLTVTGVVDASTWDALNADSAPVLTAYTILDADVAGPFTAIPEKMEDKATLTTLGFTSAAEGLGEKFHISPALLKRLNPGKDLDRAGEEIMTPNIDTNELPKAAKVIIDKSDGTLTLLDAGGKRIAQFPATTGSKHDPLPLGSWKIQSIAHHPVFHYNPTLFWDANPGEKAATIAAGPNNPVGVVWVDLSKDHYGIHGTPEPSTIGKTQSHGCIRLTNWDATAMAKSVAAGVTVLMQE
jgi:lipoprotein-anchoring transpeptidase ErfK/SrfK